MKQSKKPPLGAVPKFIHDEQRIQELQAAMGRFISANRPIPVEFVEEYNELAAKLSVEE